MNDPLQFQVGDKVQKLKGYKFPGVVVSAYHTLAGKDRYVVECTTPEVTGCQHIYSAKDLVLVDRRPAIRCDV